MPDLNGDTSTVSPAADTETNRADSSPAETPDNGQSAGESWLEDYSQALRDSLESAVSAEETEDAGTDTDASNQNGQDADTSGQGSDGSDAETTSEEPEQTAEDADADTTADNGEQTGEEETETESETDEDEDEVSPDENLPFNQHPRFRKLISQRNELKSEREKLQNRVEEVEPKAQEFDNIQSFMQTNELSSNDVAEGFRIMALMAQDPAQAREALVEHLNKLDQFTGHQLPDDLQRQVDEGQITEDNAREMTRLRNERSLESQRSQQQIEQQRQQAQEAEQQRIADQQRQAINDWEARTAQRDPDYQRKQPLIEQQLRLLVSEQQPSNADEALKLAKQAYDNVNQWVNQNMPKREEVKPAAKSDDSVTSSSAERAPNSMQDAIAAAISEG